VVVCAQEEPPTDVCEPVAVNLSLLAANVSRRVWIVSPNVSPRKLMFASRDNYVCKPQQIYGSKTPNGHPEGWPYTILLIRDNIDAVLAPDWYSGKGIPFQRRSSIADLRVQIILELTDQIEPPVMIDIFTMT